MKLIQSKKADINYLAKIIYLKEENFVAHPNADALKIAHIGGYNVIVGIDEQPGLYIYFPALSQINDKLLSFANLYRHTHKNNDPDAKAGFFEDTGRVKAIKLRGVVSDGFLLPAETLREFFISNFNITINEFEDNCEFDCIEHDNKQLWICRKYRIKHDQGSGLKGSKPIKGTKDFDKIIENQFRFHYETVKVQKEPWCIEPDDLIQITSKWHGTSLISAYVLCKKPLTLRNRIANLFNKLPWNQEHVDYDYVYSSRKVIKNQYYNKKVGSGYYNIDIWEIAHNIIKPHLIKGMTIYAEIVGYLPNGSYIQKDYDYGCIAPDTMVIDDKGNTINIEYKEGVHYKVAVYRITLTNTDGIVHEFSTREVQQWCALNGLRAVTELYYGKAVDLYPEISPLDENWNNLFWQKLANDKNFFMECDSPECNNKVPHEGLVIKKEDMVPRAWKLKTFAFTNGEQAELDKGESNIEDEN